MPASLPPIAPHLERFLNAPPAIQQEERQKAEFDGLTVWFKYLRGDLNDETVEYSGGIEAIYGPTHLYSDRLIINKKTKKGHASGEIRIVDPEGTIRGTEFDFDWGLKTGTVKDVSIQIDRMQLKAESIDITADLWKMHKVYATPSKFHRPEIAFRARDLWLRPGRNGKAFRPSVQVFGRWLGTIPFATFTLDERVPGFRLPGINFRRGEGLGISWLSGFLLSEKLSISANVSAFPKNLPSSNINLSYSTVPAFVGGGFIQPRSDLGIRFRQNYLDDIETKNPQAEERFYRTKRQTFMLGSSYNLGTEGRIVDGKQVSKQVDLVMETSGPMAGLGTFGQLRLQSIRDRTNAPYQFRALTTSAIRTPTISMGPVDARARFDFLGSSGAGTGFFGWGRLSAGGIADVGPHLKLGAEVYVSKSLGTPAFLMDRLVSHKGLIFRGDLKMGPLTLSGLTKHDLDLKKGYDTEWHIAYASGSFEPYIIVKQNPKTYGFGVRLRGQDVIDRLTTRDVKRRKN